jgi:Mrp family chromosome partitioning ATPase
MSKIFRALEHAQEELATLEKSEFFPVPETSAPVISAPETGKELSELYRAIESLLPETKSRIVQFMGSREGEGTSTITKEFARILDDKFGKKVLLLDADMKKKRKHEFIDVMKAYSLTETLLNDGTFEKAFYQVSGSRVYVSQLSHDSHFTDKVYSHLRKDHFWDRIRQSFDVILLDTPPATMSSGNLDYFKKTDGVVLVVEAEKTRLPVLESTVSKVKKSGGKMLGIVLNKRRYHIPDFIYRRL